MIMVRATMMVPVLVPLSYNHYEIRKSLGPVA